MRLGFFGFPLIWIFLVNVDCHIMVSQPIIVSLKHYPLSGEGMHECMILFNHIIYLIGRNLITYDLRRLFYLLNYFYLYLLL